MAVELIIRSVLLGVGLAMDAFSVSLADGLNERKMKYGRMLTIAGTFAAFQFVMPMTGWILVRTAVDKFTMLERFIPWTALVLLLYIGGDMLLEGLRERKKRKQADNGEPAAASNSEPAAASNSEPAAASNSEPAAASNFEPAAELTCDPAAAPAYDSAADYANEQLLGSENEGPDLGKRLPAADLILQGVATSIDALSVGLTIEAYGLMQALVSSAIIGAVTLAICLAGLGIGNKIGTILSAGASILGGVILIGIGIEIWATGIFF